MTNNYTDKQYLEFKRSLDVELPDDYCYAIYTAWLKQQQEMVE